MFKYIYKDIQASFRYLPYSCIAGAVVFVILLVANFYREKKGKEKLGVIKSTIYYVYIMVMLYITFLSREVGDRTGVDLQLFSTWGTNARNHAFVIENILLFIPYGFLSTLALDAAEYLVPCTLLGMITSLEIEVMQLITGRGYFQIDDILTNTIGTLIGFLIFSFLFKKSNKKKSKLVLYLQIPAHLTIIACLLFIMRNV